MATTSLNKKVAVGLSGGIDSSVSAYLLKEKGYEVTGVHMQCWDFKADGCSGEQDRSDAVKVATFLNIPFVALNFEKEYKERVIEYFYSEYKAGRTPNPDVMCNKEIKFGLFLNWAMEHGFDNVATGHYARVVYERGYHRLLKGIDAGKDQSYFLYVLNQTQLSKTIFPLGDFAKPEVRDLGKKIGLHNYNRPDSVGICFIGEVNIKDFLKKQIAEKAGNVITKDGEIIGQHEGIAFYTIGQRHGFSVTKYQGLPLYVIGKKVETNELVVGFSADTTREYFYVTQPHWIAEDWFKNSEDLFECEVRIRHLGETYSTKVETTPTQSGANADLSYKVNLASPIFGVAPGQSAVFYKGDEAVGGAVISS